MNILKDNIEKLSERYQACQNDIKATEDIIAEKQLELERISAQMKEAAMADDMTQYQQLSINASNLQTFLEGKKARLSGLPKTISYEEASEEWAKYTSTVEPSIEKAMAEIDKAAETLKSKYMALVEIQDAVLNNRQKVAKMAGIKWTPIDNAIPKCFPVKLAPNPKADSCRRALLTMYREDPETAPALMNSYGVLYPSNR